MPTLARNTTYYTAALTFQKVLAFLYFTLIARILGPEDVGKYVTALSFTTLFTVFVDVGLSPLLIREVAKRRAISSIADNQLWATHNDTEKNKSIEELLSKILSIKIPLALLSYGVIVAVSNLMGYQPIIRHLIYVAGIVMLLDSFSLTFWAVVRGFQTLKWESINVIIFQIILVSLGSFFLIKGYGVMPLVFALLAASLFQFFFGIHTVAAYCHKPIRSWRFNLEPRLFKSLIKISLPFALAGIFTRIYTSFDTVMISRMIGDEAVGWYSIPIKIVLAFQFLPMAFIASLYPAMSAAYAERKNSVGRITNQRDNPKSKLLKNHQDGPNKKKYQFLRPQNFVKNNSYNRLIKLFEQSMRYLMIVGFPIGFGIAALSNRLIIYIWTESFLPAVWPLRILMAGLIILFLSFPLGSLLNASNHQMINTRNIGIMLVVNIILNFILIPFFGIIGAAIASFAASLILFALNLSEVPKIIRFNPWPLIKNAIKIFLAALIMAVSAWYMREISLLIVIPFSGLIYIILLALSRAVGKSDIEIIKGIFN